MAVTLATLAGCGPSPSPSPSTSSATPPGTITVSPSVAVLASPSVGPSASGSSTNAVVADPDLLRAHLAPAIDGIPVVYDPATTALVATDPGLADDAAALAIGLVIAPGSSTADDLATISVARLRDPALDDTWYRDWRDSYDTAACDRAGGVSGHAQATIAGRTVFIGSCRNGVFTYHARIDAGAVVVSVTGLGPRKLGEKVMAGIVE
jgi:hypothetical protein